MNFGDTVDPNPGKDFTRTLNCQWRAGRAPPPHVPPRPELGLSWYRAVISRPRPAEPGLSRSLFLPPAPLKLLASEVFRSKTADGCLGCVVRGTGQGPDQGYSRTRGRSRAEAALLIIRGWRLQPCLLNSHIFSVKCMNVKSFTKIKIYCKTSEARETAHTSLLFPGRRVTQNRFMRCCCCVRIFGGGWDCSAVRRPGLQLWLGPVQGGGMTSFGGWFWNYFRILSVSLESRRGGHVYVTWNNFHFRYLDIKVKANA